MSKTIQMPALSPTMEEGTLAKWLVKEGDTVSSGDLLAEIETDKATMEFEATEGGVVAALKVTAGTEDMEEAALGVSLHQPLVISMVAGMCEFRFVRPWRFAPAPAPVLACA